MAKNKLLSMLNEINRNPKEFLPKIIWFLSLATLPNSINNSNSEFQNDLIEEFNLFLMNQNELDDEDIRNIQTVLLLIENYLNVNVNKYEISSNLFQKSKIFFDKYISNISKIEYYLSRYQQKIFISMLDKTNDLYCMPTSFGKSLLIKLVALYRANKKLRTFICVPTLALINEYLDDFNKINKHKDFPVSSIVNDTSKIFVLTQERLIDIAIQPEDILIVDESYEIDNKNIRSAILKSICNKFLKNNNVKFFQPNSLEISDDSYFVKKSINIHDLNTTICYQKIFKEWKNLKSKIINITKNSVRNNEKIAIYSYKSNHIEIAEYLYDALDYEITNDKYIEILEDLFTDNYIPVYMLRKGIVINNGEIPKIFRFITEKIYKKSNIKVIICNNTLSKGVNLGIKNLIIHSKNGISKKNDVDNFEIKNLIGRVGRITNQLLDRIGNVYICLSDKKKILKIEQAKLLNKTKYIDSSRDDDRKKIDKYSKDINNGTFEPWKYLLDRFDGSEEKFYEFIEYNKELIIDFYTNEKTIDVINKYYDFIIELYGGKEKFALTFFSTKIQGYEAFKDKIKSKKLLDYYVNVRTKMYIFNYLFRKYSIKRIVNDELNYYIKNEYYIDDKINFIQDKKKKKNSDNYYLIKNIKKEDSMYKKIITKITNNILNDSNKFYDGNFQLIERKIFKIFIEKYDIDLQCTKDEVTKIIEYFNLPNDFRQLIMKYNIKNIKDFEDSELYEILF